MSFVSVICEGECEMDFVQGVLGPHLSIKGITVQGTVVGKTVSRDLASSPGGILKFDPLYRHIRAELRRVSSPTSVVTTMVDLYAFPRDLDGFGAISEIADPYERVIQLETLLQRRIGDTRFFPYVQLHEFEALVLSDMEILRRELDESDATEGIGRLLADLGDLEPEEVDQSPQGAPSKRLQRFLPGYRKRTMARSVTSQIGCDRLRRRCPHFGSWLDRLEALSPSAPL